MKVCDICHDVQDVLMEGGLKFNDLSSLHIGALKAINDGRLDFEEATDRMMDVVYELEEYGLIDQYYKLTDPGQQAIELTQTLGGSRDRRRAATMQDPADIDLDDTELDNQLSGDFNVDDVYDDDYGGNFELGDDDSVMQQNRAGGIIPHA
jgi:hypothetical protein